MLVLTYIYKERYFSLKNIKEDLIQSEFYNNDNVEF